jgi:hypothetical protein
MNLRDEIERLRALLKEARQYVSDAGGDEDPETQSHSQALLAEIDAAIAKVEGGSRVGGKSTGDSLAKAEGVK